MSAKKDPPPGKKADKGEAAEAPRGPKHVGPGDVLNHMFEVRRSIGRGGMGEVFEGINVSTEEPVAIKVILPHLAADPQVLAMFRREAITLTRLSHPALVQYRTQALDPQLGAYYIVTEFIRGDNLSDVLGQIEAGPGDLVALTRRLAEGLAAAHRLDAIHRDIAPDNIMLPVGRLDQARIIDFGIAKDLDAGSATIVGDGFAGKLNYVAPEQLGEYGREIGPWTDVYSLALTILAVARKKDVDLGGTLVDAVDKRRKGVDVSAAPAVLHGVLGTMLEHNPAERFRSMEAVIDALDRLDPAGFVEALPPVPSEAAAPEPWGEVPTADAITTDAGEEGAFSSSWADLPSEDDASPTGAGAEPGSQDEGWTVFLPGKKTDPADPKTPAKGDAKKRTFLGMPAVIAGSLLVVLLLAMAVWRFAFGGEHDKPVADTQSAALAPEAQVAKARRLLADLLPAQECTALTLGDIAYRDGGLAIAVGGIAGTAERSAAAQEAISRSLGAEGLTARSMDFSAVTTVDIGDCRPIDVFKRFAGRDGPRLTFPKTEWEVQRLGAEGGSSRQGQLGVRVQGEANLAGVAAQSHIVLLGKDRLHFDDRVLAETGSVGPDRYRVDPGFEAQDAGWWAVVMVTGQAPFDASILNGSLGEKPDWSDRFSAAATAQGWTVDVAWIHVVDEIPD